MQNLSYISSASVSALNPVESSRDEIKLRIKTEAEALWQTKREQGRILNAKWHRFEGKYTKANHLSFKL